MVRVRDNLSIHLAPELAAFAAENQDWLRLYRLPAWAPDLNPAEGTWPLPKRSMANFAAADQAGLVRVIKGKLKKIQYRPRLINGCLAAAGLRTEPWQSPALRAPSAVSPVSCYRGGRRGPAVTGAVQPPPPAAGLPIRLRPGLSQQRSSACAAARPGPPAGHRTWC